MFALRAAKALCTGRQMAKTQVDRRHGRIPGVGRHEQTFG
jgi:hypothetical protein